MEASLDFLHDFVDGFETEGRENVWSYDVFKGAYWVDPSVNWTDKKSTMRAIKFLKTLVSYYNNADWTKVEEQVPFLFDDTDRYFWYLHCEIQQLYKYGDSGDHLGSMLGDTFLMIALSRKKVGKIYRKVIKMRHPAVFLEADGIDEFTNSVQQYLMNVPGAPIGWGRMHHEYCEVEQGYKDAWQNLERFRSLVCCLSKQKKVQGLLDYAAGVVFLILHSAYKIDVYKIATAEMESKIIRSSAEMSLKLLPHILQVLPSLEPVNLIGSEDLADSLLSALQVMRKMALILREFLEFPIADLLVDDDNVEVGIFLKQVYGVLAGHAAFLRSSVLDYAVLSNLLHKLNLIRCNIFVMELLNHSTVTIREAIVFMCHIFKKDINGYMELSDVSMLKLIQSFLIDTGSLCDSTKTRPFSDTMILESSLAIFKLFKAEAVLTALIQKTSNLDLRESFAIDMLLKSLTISRELFLGTQMKDGNVSTVRETLTSNATSFVCSSEDRNRRSMEVSIFLLLDKLHDFLKESQNEVYESTYRVINSSVRWIDKNYTMRAIKFLKSFRLSCNASWSGVNEAKHFSSLCDHLKNYFRWLEPEITEVVGCDDDPCHLASALSRCLVMIHILHCGVARIYDEWMEVSHTVPFVDGLVFDEFVDSVQQYLMNVPKEPFGWGHCAHEYSQLQRNYEDTVLKMECFRCIVLSYSKQCPNQKLQYVLFHAAAVVFSILHMAYTSDVDRTDTREMEDNIIRSSFDMLWMVSPQNQDARLVYQEFLSANVEFIRISKSKQSPGPVQTIVESFHELLQSARNQFHILGEIFEHGIMNSIVDDPDDHATKDMEILLRQGYVVVARETGCIQSHVVLPNLLQKLNLIKAEMFVLELYNHKSSLTSFDNNQAASIRGAFKYLSQFLKTAAVDLVDNDKSILQIIEVFVREAGSLCDSREALVLESSLAIFKLFRAKAMLLVLTDSIFSLNFLAEFHVETLHSSSYFLREILLGTPIDILDNGNITTIGGTVAEIPGEYLSQYFSLFDSFPRSDGIAFAENVITKIRKCLTNVPADAFMNKDFEVLLSQLESNVSTLMDVKRENSGLRVKFLMYAAEYAIDLFVHGCLPLSYFQLLLFISIEEMKLSEAQITDHLHDKESFALPLKDVLLTREGSNSRNEEVVVGIDDRAESIVKLLKTASNNRQVVSLVGMAGIGKTTLAEKVYSHDSIQYHYAVRAWCCVSQVYRKREVLLDLLGDSVDVSDDMKKMDDNDLALKVKQRLSGKRYLIVVDELG